LICAPKLEVAQLYFHCLGSAGATLHSAQPFDDHARLAIAHALKTDPAAEIESVRRDALELLTKKRGLDRPARKCVPGPSLKKIVSSADDEARLA
jgi:hypothetical protein